MHFRPLVLAPLAGILAAASEPALLFFRNEQKKYGYLDLEGRVVIEAKYENTFGFREGLAPVQFGGKYGYIDRTGRMVIEPRFEFASVFDEGMAPVKLNGKFGFIDRTGRVVIEPIYEAAERFSEGLAAVKLNGKVGFVDRTGKMVIEPRYEKATPFSGGASQAHRDSRYIWLRFEWQYALGSVIALIHDIFITIGVFAIFQLKFDLTTVAAVLTIIGYSVNDSIVIFDRIRETSRREPTLVMKDVINKSINQTLSRTLLTSLTVLFVVVILFIFGGSVIQDFALALIVGVIVGTYSSVFIASPIVLYWEKGARGKSKG